jgi:hypothetical protein
MHFKQLQRSPRNFDDSNFLDDTLENIIFHFRYTWSMYEYIADGKGDN